MKKRWLVLGLLLTASSCDEINVPEIDDDTRIVGSGHVVTETRQVAGFSAVTIAASLASASSRRAKSR